MNRPAASAARLRYARFLAHFLWTNVREPPSTVLASRFVEPRAERPPHPHPQVEAESQFTPLKGRPRCSNLPHFKRRQISMKGGAAFALSFTSDGSLMLADGVGRRTPCRRQAAPLCPSMVSLFPPSASLLSVLPPRKLARGAVQRGDMPP